MARTNEQGEIEQGQEQEQEQSTVENTGDTPATSPNGVDKPSGPRVKPGHKQLVPQLVALLESVPEETVSDALDDMLMQSMAVPGDKGRFLRKVSTLLTVANVLTDRRT